jgi:hypothetical protein
MKRRAILAGLLPWAGFAHGQPLPEGSVPVGNVLPQEIAQLSAPNAADGADFDMSFMTPGKLDPRATFTRGSTATYFDATGTMQTAAANVPRWDYDPATLALRGLFFEENRTNLFPNSTSWRPAVPPSSTVDGIILNAGTAPDGSSAAMLLIPGMFSSVLHQFFPPSFVGALSTVYTLSCYVKAAGYTGVRFSLGNTGFPTPQIAAFDLAAGTVVLQPANRSATIQACAGGWYRISVQNTSGATSGAYIAPTVVFDTGANAQSGTAFVGDGVSGILSWGLQVEAAAFATSHIPTTGTTATRAADTVTAAAAPWYVPGPGTLQVEALKTIGPNNKGVVAVGLRASSNNANTSIIVTGGNYVSMYDNTTGLNNAMGPEPLGTVWRAAFGFSAGSQRSSLNGGNVVGMKGAVITTGITTLDVGNRLNASQYNGYLRRARYWSRMLSDGELIAASAGAATRPAPEPPQREPKRGG